MITYRSRLPLLVCSLLFLAGCAWVWPFLIDDVYISLRYAQHWAEGYGPQFNLHDAPTEGYTNFLLVAIEAALYQCGVRDMLPIKLVLVIAGLMTLWRVSWYAQRRAPNRPVVQIAAVGFLATSTPFVVWSVGGLETSIYCFLVVSAAACMSRWLKGEPGFAGLACMYGVLAVLTRPDGALVLTVSGMWFLSSMVQRRRPSRIDLIGIAAGVVGLVLYAYWKLRWFGSLVPVTYAAKQSGKWDFGGGWQRFQLLLSIDGNRWLLCGLFIVAGVLVWRKCVSLATIYLASLVLATLASVMSFGFGVAMDMCFRLYVPSLALTALLIVDVGASSRSIKMPRSVVGALALTVILMRINCLHTFWVSDVSFRTHGTLDFPILSGFKLQQILRKSQIHIGHWLRHHSRPGDVLMCTDAGAMPYFSGLETVDTLSLIDPHIIATSRAIQAVGTGANARRNAQHELYRYLWSKDPTFIIEGEDRGLLETHPACARQFHEVASFPVDPPTIVRVWKRFR